MRSRAQRSRTSASSATSRPTTCGRSSSARRGATGFRCSGTSATSRKPRRSPPPPPRWSASPLTYRLQTFVPWHWFPMVPVMNDPLSGATALEQGRMVRPDGRSRRRSVVCSARTRNRTGFAKKPCPASAFASCASRYGAAGCSAVRTCGSRGANSWGAERDRVVCATTWARRLRRRDRLSVATQPSLGSPTIDGGQDALAQEVGIRSSIHLPLGCLEPVGTAFGVRSARAG